MNTSFYHIKHRLTKLAVALTLPLVGVGGGLLSTACADMLDSPSSRYNVEPELDAKTDSVFYVMGIFEAMQRLADQYVFLGEMRGDLTQTTLYTDSTLRQLANFQAHQPGAANRYDSAYVYYRVINNCNYYIQHRNTDLYTGSTNVVINEFAAVKALRAWAYLQLGRNYQRVKFFTEPLTQISQIDDNTFPELTLEQIVAELAPDLEQYTGYQVPIYDGWNTGIGIGSPLWNTSATKVISTARCFIPVDIVLGDMYLEVGGDANYRNAARHYVKYLTDVAPNNIDRHSKYACSLLGGGFSIRRMVEMPSDLKRDDHQNYENRLANWNGIFSSESTIGDLITYIPMATSRQNGVTTVLPESFGYRYYSTSDELSASGSLYIDENQIVPSQAYYTLADSTWYYYFATNSASQSTKDYVSKAQLGDLRGNIREAYSNTGATSPLEERTITDSDQKMVYITKYNVNANIILYRVSTVWLHLAEAFNRMGYPDAAFAILKDGISADLLDRANYISDATKQMLQSADFGLLSTKNIENFSHDYTLGIHQHGAGACSDYNGNSYMPGLDGKGLSPYRMGSEIERKMRELSGLSPQMAEGFPQVASAVCSDSTTLEGNVVTYIDATKMTRQDSINAVEDLLCDEYAMELAWEGSRYYDLVRMARHKNLSGIYGGNFGSLWLARKLAYKHPAVNMADPNNWFLPFH